MSGHLPLRLSAEGSDEPHVIINGIDLQDHVVPQPHVVQYLVQAGKPGVRWSILLRHPHEPLERSRLLPADLFLIELS
jgi:hypothetical protein